LIKVLVESRALECGSFTLKSGRISPYFINMARALSTGEFASRTSKAYVEEIHSQLEDDFDYIHGPAYKGIPLAALVSCNLYTLYNINKRWGYDRKEEKAYGDLTEKMIVGDLKDGDRILLIDDVITTGKTKIDNWKKLTALRKNLHPKGILIAVDRQEKEESGESVTQLLKKEGFNLFSILGITEVFSYLYENPIHGKRYVDDNTLGTFEQYLATYGV
jgi:orotate phosphoribosyltransferase